MTDAVSQTNDTRLRARIRQFFFAQEVPYGLAMLRISLPLVLLMAMLPRWAHTRELYSSDGAPAPLWLAYGHFDLLPEASGTVAVCLHSALILFLVTSSLGWCTRFSLAGSTVIYTYFSLFDALGTMTKYSVISSHVLALLTLSQCGAVWSIDSWYKRRRRAESGQAELSSPLSAAWPRRLIQLLVGVIYFGAAITKIHTPTYFTSDQLHAWLLTDLNYSNPFGEWMALRPVLLVIPAYIVIIWEMVFPFIVWKGWGRLCCLGVGILFHLLTIFMLGLQIFPLVYFALYLAFTEPHDAARFSLFWKRIRHKLGFSAAHSGQHSSRLENLSLPRILRIPSAALFVVVALAAISFGVELEHRIDPYGERRAEGKHTLRELDPRFVENTLLAPSQPIRDVDKFGPLKLGTLLVGQALAYERLEFRQGEQMIAHCTVHPPHEDMWVDCCLLDAQNRIVETNGQVIPRESLRASYAFALSDSLQPGDYSIVVKCAGQEVGRRRFKLNPGTDSATIHAN